MIIEGIFFDRDGTLGGDGHFCHPNAFTLFDETKRAFKLLEGKDIKTFAFTNQHRISKGQVNISDFEKEFKSYGFDDAYICPHDLHNQYCSCQKQNLVC